MKTILIATPKGGAGKTTLSTNLAGMLAARGEKVCLWDLDRQKSAMGWLAQRPAHLPVIHRLDSGKEKTEAEYLVLDSPAGLHGDKLSDLLKRVEKVLVPIVPSSFDLAATGAFLKELAEVKAVRKGRAFVAIVGMRVDARTRAAEKLDEFLVPIVPSSFDLAATGAFLKELAEVKAVRKGRAFVAIVGMRVDARTRAAEKLDEFLAPIDLPVLTHLRDTQNYVTAAFEGKSIFDMAPSTVAIDLLQWQPIARWVRE